MLALLCLSLICCAIAVPIVPGSALEPGQGVADAVAPVIGDQSAVHKEATKEAKERSKAVSKLQKQNQKAFDNMDESIALLQQLAVAPEKLEAAVVAAEKFRTAVGNQDPKFFQGGEKR